LASGHFSLERARLSLEPLPDRRSRSVSRCSTYGRSRYLPVPPSGCSSSAGVSSAG
jgi:hypothetical protein